MSKGWTLRYYFIALIDVLGQSKKLMNLKKLPITLDEKERASEILHDTAGYINDLRGDFRSFFRARNKATGILDTLPPDKREKAEKARRTEVIIKNISDTIIIMIPLNNEYNHCVSVGSIYSALYGISVLFVVALVKNKPFRCGIDIGVGVPLLKNEVYGEALIKAYELEKNTAKYPRIVVGSSLYDYLNMIHKLDSNTDYAKLAKKWAGDSKLFIINDHDRIKILDVIGEKVKSISEFLDSNFVEKAYSFIVNSQSKYKNSGDVELYFRYSHLRDYFESRLHLWNIKPVIE